MLAKKVRTKEWCPFIAMARHNIPNVKRWRCPECGKRFLVYQKLFDEIFDLWGKPGQTYNVISKHKREV